MSTLFSFVFLDFCPEALAKKTNFEFSGSINHVSFYSDDDRKIKVIERKQKAPLKISKSNQKSLEKIT